MRQNALRHNRPSIASILPVTTARDVSFGSLPVFCLYSALNILIHRAHVAIHDWMLPLGKNIIRTLFHGVPESVVGKFVDTALVTAAGEMGMMRLRTHSLIIAFMRKAPFCFYRTLPKVSSSLLGFSADARYSLIRIIHLPTDGVIQHRCTLMFRHRSRLSARAKVTSLIHITISRTYDTHQPGHQVHRTLPPRASFKYDSNTFCAAMYQPAQCHGRLRWTPNLRPAQFILNHLMSVLQVWHKCHLCTWTGESEFIS